MHRIFGIVLFFIGLGLFSPLGSLLGDAPAPSLSLPLTQALTTPQPLREPELTDCVIDPSFFEPASEQGTLIRGVYYATQDYVYGDVDAYEKYMQVYLPYGYDENGHYDVLFLLHVRQQYNDYWLTTPHYYMRPDGSAVSVDAVNLLDNLIERGLCKPMIVVAPDGYLSETYRWEHRSEQVYPQFAEEFARDILPFVAEHYATWAEGSDRASLAAAREHFGLLGASFGAFEIELSVLGPNLDLAAWYALAGGGDLTYDEFYPQWSARGTLELPIRLLYLIEGEYDDIGPVEGSYLTLPYWSEKFTRDENLRFTRLRETGHEERAWVNALYNTAQLFFR